MHAMILRFYDTELDDETIHDKMGDLLDSLGLVSFALELGGATWIHAHPPMVDEDGDEEMPDKMAEDMLRLIGRTTEDMEHFLETGSCVREQDYFV